MKPIHDFVAARPLARHCPELLPPARDPADRLPDLARLGSRLAPLLATRLVVLGCDDALSVTTLAVREASAADVLHDGDALAVHWLLSVPAAEAAVLVSAAADPLFQMVDRAFGGRGQAPAHLPGTLSPTAELFAARLGAAVAESLSEVVGGGGTAVVERQGTVLADLSPFAAGERLAVLECEMTEPGRAPWTLRLVLPVRSIGGIAAGEPIAGRAPRGPADPGGQLFGEVPLTLHAVLVDMAVPMAAIAALTPGALLPVAVSRRVPLRVGGQTVASGVAGTHDDRVALQLRAPELPLEIR